MSPINNFSFTMNACQVDGFCGFVVDCVSWMSWIVCSFYLKRINLAQLPFPPSPSDLAWFVCVFLSHMSSVTNFLRTVNVLRVDAFWGLIVNCVFFKSQTSQPVPPRLGFYAFAQCGVTLGLALFVLSVHLRRSDLSPRPYVVCPGSEIIEVRFFGFIFCMDFFPHWFVILLTLQKNLLL